ncbi:MAG: hypothetical protein HC896_07245 [Bacteroidales bacterium]|nr:hypothetical protein [Bacteroidales bacterium]
MQTRGEVKQQASAIIDNLESLKNKVEEEYSQLARNSEQGRDAGEIEKNIFTSIDAFNNAFTKAGSIFKG